MIKAKGAFVSNLSYYTSRFRWEITSCLQKQCFLTTVLFELQDAKSYLSRRFNSVKPQGNITYRMREHFRNDKKVHRESILFF